MCHLAVEKAIKGLYYQRTKQIPPKTHNLVYLINKLKIHPEKRMAKLIVILNEANISTRYPESLELLQKNYTKSVAENVIKQSEEIIKWIKEQF